MLLSELIAAVVVDVDGRKVGAVGDVRLVQDGPLLDPFGAALRVEGLVAGRNGLATRLGYHRGDVVGPRLLAKLFRAVEGSSRYVPWDVVERVEDGHVHLSVRSTDLSPLSG
jgi:sporulation protein YlmC with PRC-barrel domain